MCDPHRHFVRFSAVPGSPHLHQYLSSPARTKTRSTSSPRVLLSAPSNCLAPCTSAWPQSPRRTRRTPRRAPPRTPREPRWCMAPPLRSPPAPAQTTPWRRPARPQRLQSPRQTAQPSARAQQSGPPAPGAFQAQQPPSPLTVPPTLPSAGGSLCLSVLSSPPHNPTSLPPSA